MNNITKETYELIREAVELIPKKFFIDSVEIEPDSVYKLNTEDTLWLQSNGRMLTIGGNQYTIVEVQHNEYVRVKGNANINTTDFDIYPINFINGTKLVANKELSQKNTVEERLPMVYLYEVLREENSNSDEDNIGRTVDLSLYFLGGIAIQSHNSNEKRYIEAVKPMRNAINSFIENVLNEYTENFGDIDSYTTIPYPKFGTEQEKGIDKWVFDTQCGGIGLQIRIPFRKKFCCC